MSPLDIPTRPIGTSPIFDLYQFLESGGQLATTWYVYLVPSTSIVQMLVSPTVAHRTISIAEKELWPTSGMNMRCMQMAWNLHHMPQGSQPQYACWVINVVSSKEYIKDFKTVNDQDACKDHESKNASKAFWIHAAIAYNVCVACNIMIFVAAATPLAPRDKTGGTVFMTPHPAALTVHNSECSSTMQYFGWWAIAWAQGVSLSATNKQQQLFYIILSAQWSLSLWPCRLWSPP